ncbi:DUF1772 domain-containing protein [Pseudonocardia eucalypti]|uniref:DUF1772 domain-containing protein n=1 Tax=Pseudonocardia eucalypti TaxID=648755 RepID=A0ABP9QP51_9PSEU|nr:putative membrane protein [Pseudonocardia eucalypti]
MRTLSLMVATVSMALGAGVFLLYAHTIMPGLGHTDDRTFVAAFQEIDRSVLNPWFIGFSFFGALVFGILAAVLNRGRPALRWILLALALHLVVVVLTVSINVPLNDAIKAAGDPDRIPDLAAVRAAFDEAKWRTWNVVRTLLDLAAFVSLAWALVLHGRSTPAVRPKG